MTETAIRHGKPSGEHEQLGMNKPLESVAGPNSHVTRSKNQYATMEQKC